jgi:hypothetical protein
MVMSIEISTASSVVIPASEDVIIKDFFVYCQGGVPVLNLDATFDFNQINPADHAFVLNMLLQQRMRLMGPTEEAMKRDARRSTRYKKRKAEYEALPWYKRVLTQRPGAFDPENEED